MMQRVINNIEYVCTVGGEIQSGITGKKRTRDKSVAQASTQQGTTDACAYLYYDFLLYRVM